MLKIIDFSLTAFALVLALFIILPTCAMCVWIKSIPEAVKQGYEFIRVIMENERKQKGGVG